MSQTANKIGAAQNQFGCLANNDEKAYEKHLEEIQSFKPVIFLYI